MLTQISGEDTFMKMEILIMIWRLCQVLLYLYSLIVFSEAPVIINKIVKFNFNSVGILV